VLKIQTAAFVIPLTGFQHLLTNNFCCVYTTFQAVRDYYRPFHKM